MSFYRQLSKYYDRIFPIGKAQVELIAESAGTPPKRMLDIACGAGGYALELAKRGYSVTAIDLDAGMVKSLQEKIRSTNLQISAIQGNMLELEHSLGKQQYDVAFCIGNSLVHLDGAEEVSTFLKAVKQLLAGNGSSFSRSSISTGSSRRRSIRCLLLRKARMDSNFNGCTSMTEERNGSGSRRCLKRRATYMKIR